MITLDYIKENILTDEIIILNIIEIHNLLSSWARNFNNLDLKDIYSFYISGHLNNDGSVFFYNILKVCKYLELNKLL